MGDRTWVQLEYPKEQESLFLTEFPYLKEENQCDVKDGTVSVTLLEENYGGTDKLKKLSKQGAVFDGNHGAGDDYGEISFASDGKRYAEICSLDGQPIAIIDETGRASPNAVKNILKHNEISVCACAIMSWIQRQSREDKPDGG